MVTISVVYLRSLKIQICQIITLTPFLTLGGSIEAQVPCLVERACNSLDFEP